MKTFLTLLFLSFGGFLQAQDYYDFTKKAHELMNQNKLDSAIYFYSLAKQSDSSHHKLYATYMMANCLYKTGKVNEAENEYLAALEINYDKKSFINFKHSSSIRLYELCLEKKEYAAALKYLRLANEKHKQRRFCNTSAYEDNREMQFRFLKLFDKLDMPDSAIHRFTPFVFDNLAEMYEYDTADYKQMVDDYYNILEKKYSPCEIFTKLEKALNESKYVLEKDDDTYWTLDCSIFFISNRVYMHHPGGWFINKEDLKADYLQKNNLINRLKKSYGYHLMVKHCGSQVLYVAK